MLFQERMGGQCVLGKKLNPMTHGRPPIASVEIGQSTHASYLTQDEKSPVALMIHSRPLISFHASTNLYCRDHAVNIVTRRHGRSHHVATLTLLASTGHDHGVMCIPLKDTSKSERTYQYPKWRVPPRTSR